MNKVVYIAQLYEEWILDGKEDHRIDPERVFLTQESAIEYALSHHPHALSDGWEYIWPDEGMKTWRCYWIDPIVLEEK